MRSYLGNGIWAEVMGDGSVELGGEIMPCSYCDERVDHRITLDRQMVEELVKKAHHGHPQPPSATEQPAKPAPTWELVEACERALKHVVGTMEAEYSYRSVEVNFPDVLAAIQQIADARGGR